MPVILSAAKNLRPASCGFFPFVPQGFGSLAQNDRHSHVFVHIDYKLSTYIYTTCG